MKITLVIISILVGCIATAQNIKPNLIPVPLSVKIGNGLFEIKPSTIIEIRDGSNELAKIAGFLSAKIAGATGFQMAINKANSKKNGNTILLGLVADTSLGNEGYTLNISSTGVSILANTPNGVFYGMQTLLQLLPNEIESKSVVKNIAWTLPLISIIDKPRFGWRGLMLDVSRHFFDVNQVKDFIDNMVRYKFNLLHLHLTDDQGWRLQINALPKLTETGAWRPNRQGKWGNVPQTVDSTEPRTYGGFFTQDDIRDLLQYAKDRYVNILPEIDIPGHSMAAIAAYPELTGTPGKYYVNAGEKFMQWYGGGKFSALVDNNLCPAKESVFVFLDSVITEVAQLFPFEYLHIGGDEAAKNIWETTDTIKALMKKEGLLSLEEVQSYFIKRVQKIVEAKGKKMIGWDEILEGGLDTAATVMSWRGMKGGIAAAKENHKVVMSPSDFVYLDLMQGDKITEPYVYSTVRLSKTYQFDPVPPGVNPDLILGGQGNLWTEQIPQMRALQYMLWPRALAVAESVWSAKERKNYNDFIGRVENEFQRLDLCKVKYAQTMYEPIITALYDKQVLKVKMENEVDGLTLYYSLDETNPDEFYPFYKSPIAIPKDVATLKVVAYKNGKQVGRQINIPFAELEKRAGKK